MNISSYNSTKIRVLSFIAIILVLYIHAIYKESINFPIANSVQIFFGYDGIGLIANPLFYCISGFLFFVGIKTVADCTPKIHKRIKSLMIPYLIWNIVFVLWYVALDLIPGASKYVNSDMVGSIFNTSFCGSIKELFITPAAFQLWFLRDLILYVLLSPIFYFLLKKVKLGLPFLLFVGGIIGLLYLPSEIKIWGAFYFVLGGYIGLYIPLDSISQKISLRVATICGFLYLLNALLRAFVLYQWKGSDMVVEMCGLIAIWKLYDTAFKYCNEKWIILLSSLGGYAFFIYLFHEPVFNIIKKTGIKLVNQSEPSLILLYILNPIIMAIIAIAVAKCLKKLTPNIYKILIGGR